MKPGEWEIFLLPSNTFRYPLCQRSAYTQLCVRALR